MCKRCTTFFFNIAATAKIYSLSLHDALPIYGLRELFDLGEDGVFANVKLGGQLPQGLRLLLVMRSEEHTSELQSRVDIVCRLLLEKKKETITCIILISLVGVSIGMVSNLRRC